MMLGQGRMTEIRGAHPILRPFFLLGNFDHLVFAERGSKFLLLWKTMPIEMIKAEKL